MAVRVAEVLGRVPGESRAGVTIGAEGAVFAGEGEVAGLVGRGPGREGRPGPLPPLSP